MLYIYSVWRKDRTDGIDEEEQISPLFVSKDKEKAYKRACLAMREEIEKDAGLKNLNNLKDLPESGKKAEVLAKKLGYEGNILQEDRAFLAYESSILYDIDFTELRVEECIHIEIE